MVKRWILFAFVLINISAFAQDKTLKVWPNGAPDDNGMKDSEVMGNNQMLRNISEAEMYVYLPEKDMNTGAAVVICPGGGYILEAMGHEGYDVAKWLASKGIAGIVLKYRLPYEHDKIPSEDVRRAIRIVRQHSEDWGINSEKVGLAGSSAGGHLASTVGTQFDYGNAESNDPVEKMSSRPDFMLLLYPVITMREEFTHTGSRLNLLGDNAPWAMVKKYSGEMNVTPETPTTFLVLADDDDVVPTRNSIEFYSALKKNNVPAEMHIFKEGGHGFGINKLNKPVDQWPDLFYDWLKASGIIE